METPTQATLDLSHQASGLLASSRTLLEGSIVVHQLRIQRRSWQPADLGRVALPGRSPGRVLPQDRGLGDG